VKLQSAKRKAVTVPLKQGGFAAANQAPGDLLRERLLKPERGCVNLENLIFVSHRRKMGFTVKQGKIEIDVLRRERAVTTHSEGRSRSGQPGKKV